MKISIIGSGAMGGLLGAKLFESGQDVSLIDQGPHLEAIQRHGLRLVGPGDAAEIRVRPPAHSIDDRLARQNIVFLAMKAHQLQTIVHRLPPLFHHDTVLVTLQNGIPWWYFHRHGGLYDGRIIESVDPQGLISAAIDPHRILGCVPYAAAEVIAPGVVKHIEGFGFPLGELDNSKSERAQRVSQVLVKAGFKAPVLTDLRSEIWLKLWGVLAFNPISALTGATLVDICRHPQARLQVIRMMREAEDIAVRLGVKFRVPLERRVAGAAAVGAHKTSTLQDIEWGRRTEIDALLGSVIELGQLSGVEMPHMEAVYACFKLFEKTVAEKRNKSQAGLERVLQ